MNWSSAKRLVDEKIINPPYFTRKEIVSNENLSWSKSSYGPSLEQLLRFSRAHQTSRVHL